MIDTANLAMLVSETTDTLGFGRRNEEVASINMKNMEEDYRDSIILPFGAICGQYCNSDGTEQGIFGDHYSLFKSMTLDG